MPVPPAVMLPTTITGTGAFQARRMPARYNARRSAETARKAIAKRQEDERAAAQALPFPFEPGAHCRCRAPNPGPYLRDWVVKEMWL